MIDSGPLFIVEENFGKSVPKYIKKCIQNNEKIKNKGSKKLVEAKIRLDLLLICTIH